MRFQTLFFDLDETLYPSSSGLWSAISARIEKYMSERVGLPVETIPNLRRDIFKTYGTTLRGLKVLYGIDEEDYLQYVHDIPLEQYLKPNLVLQKILADYPHNKVIFTNADTSHARRVLFTLGIEDFFSTIIDIRAISPYCKPMPEAFQIALQINGLDNGNGCVLIDDSPNNLLEARRLGFFTIAVGKLKSDGWHTAINRIEDLPSVLPFR